MADWRMIYKRTWGDRKIVPLSEGAELHFIKLITVQDDEGFIEGDEILSQCYPGRLNITQSVIDERNKELAESDPDDPLVVIHTNGTRTVLQLPTASRHQKIRRDRKRPSKLRILVDKWQPVVDKCPPTLHNTTHTTQKEEGASDKTPTPASAVYSTLQSVNAKVYRDLKPNDAFDAILNRESLRLGGPDRILAITQQFAVWMEDQLTNGKLKREAKHRPRKRFADWLARENPIPAACPVAIPVKESYLTKLDRERPVG